VAATLILKPYEQRRPPGPFRRFLTVAVLVFLAAFYRLMYSILPMQLFVVPLVPILFMIALILWMMPDVGGVRENLLAKKRWSGSSGSTFSGQAMLLLTPPGLPWITPTRLIVFTMLAVFAAVKLAGYTDAQVIEIVQHVALNSWTNFFNEVFQTDIDFQVVEARTGAARAA
jgi:hypothetical protein